MKANSDVINKHPSTLIIGYGWVGQFIGKYFTEAHWTDETGKYHLVDGDTEVEPPAHYDLAFICVPTPMLPNGRCDTSIVENAVSAHKNKVDHFCIKSTVEVGTTDRLREKHKVEICMSPEFLGETLGHPLNEPRRDTYVILGGDKDVTGTFADAWTLVTNAYTRIYRVSAKTAELCKLMDNAFVATKVMFCNEFFDLAQSVGVDYHELREVWLTDPRITPSHTYVYPNNRGFSGKCIPKDLNNIASFFESVGAKPHLVDFLLRYNARLRKGYQNSVPLLAEGKRML